VSGSTPTYGLPYPSLSDAPDGATQMQALATATDTALAAEAAARAAAITGLYTPKYALKTTAKSYSASTSFTNEVDLVLNLDVATAVYEIHGFISYDAPATPMFKHTIPVPIGATLRYACTHQNTSGVTYCFPCNGADTVSSYGLGIGNRLAIEIDGLISMNGNTGVIQMAFANNASGSGGFNIYEGSYLRAVRMK
jgi:hypothetical protein